MDRAKFLKILELSSVVCFGLAYWQYDLQIATIVLIAVMTFFVGVALLLRHPLSKMQWISWVAILVLGGAGVLSQDDTLIKWKPTVIHLIIGVAFLATNFIGQETLVEKLTRNHLKAPRVKLRRLNIAVGLYCFFIAAINLLVAHEFNNTIWVQFKLFGILGLNIIFISSALYYLREWLNPTVKSQ